MAVPYGELSARQLRMLARIAANDRPDPALLAEAQATQEKRCTFRRPTVAALHQAEVRLRPLHHAHQRASSTGFRCQGADVMDLLATVQHARHPDQRQRIRNITCDAWPALPDEHRRPARLPRSCASGARCTPSSPPAAQVQDRLQRRREDRAAIGWYDIGLQARKNDAGEVVSVRKGGGMGRTPIIGGGARVPALGPALNYIEAIVIRVYNRYGRRDNKWKARIKILVKAKARPSSTR